MSKSSNRSMPNKTTPYVAGPAASSSAKGARRTTGPVSHSKATREKHLLGLSTGAYWIIGVVAAAALIGASFLPGGGSKSSGGGAKIGPNGVEIGTLAVGSTAPAFSGTNVLTGKVINSSTLAGRNVLYFFSSGSTCQACMGQAQALQQDIAQLRKDHLTLVMVTNDSTSSLLAAARAYKLTLPMVADPIGALTNLFGAVGGGMDMGANTADHSFILVDKSGVVRFHRDFPGMWITTAALMSKFPRMLQ